MSDPAGIGATGRAWTPPRLQLARSEPEPEPEPVDPVAIAEEARRTGHEEGHKAGYEAGFAEGAAAGRSLAENIAEEMGTLLAAMAEPYRELDAALIADLVSLVERAGEAVVRRELVTGTVEIETLLRETLAVLGDARGRVELTLHPRDATLLREAGLDLEPYQLIEDATLSRGGLRLSAENSFVDASLDARLQAVFEAFRENADLPLAADAAAPPGEGD